MASRVDEDKKHVNSVSSRFSLAALPNPSIGPLKRVASALPVVVPAKRTALDSSVDKFSEDNVVVESASLGSRGAAPPDIPCSKTQAQESQRVLAADDDEPEEPDLDADQSAYVDEELKVEDDHPTSITDQWLTYQHDTSIICTPKESEAYQARFRARLFYTIDGIQTTPQCLPAVRTLWKSRRAPHPHIGLYMLLLAVELHNDREHASILLIVNVSVSVSISISISMSMSMSI